MRFLAWLRSLFIRPKSVLPPQVRDLLLKSLDTIDKLETYEGHLLNWYDTNTLQPL